MDKIRDQLRSIIVNSGCSESSISEKSGFSRGVVSQFLSGNQSIGLIVLVQIGETLGYRLKFDRIEK